MTLILVPKPVPPGEKVTVGQKYEFPTCDRCMRESSDRNPVMLSVRPSWNQKFINDHRTLRDAICYECRLAMKGRY